tara:strand:- start:909 stop:1196 length:288 start_codon:yes stop_codon:yes gene_type:complete
MSAFSKVGLGTTQKIQQMRQEVIFTDGQLSTKFKALAAMLCDFNSRCEPCLKFYVLKTKELGVSEEEFGKLLAIAPSMGSCIEEIGSDNWCQYGS